MVYDLSYRRDNSSSTAKTALCKIFEERKKEKKDVNESGNVLEPGIGSMEEFIQNKKHALQAKKEAELLTEEEMSEEKEQIYTLEEYFLKLKEMHVCDVGEGFEKIREMFEENCLERKKLLKNMADMLERSFAYVADCFGEAQEILLLETGITGNQRICSFISDHGCPSYFKYSTLLLYGKQEDAMRERCREILENTLTMTTELG